jgi:SAM-dependent methyltransferase
MWTVERFPQLRPALWRSFYRALAAYSRRAEYWTFMNYRYVDENPGARPELAPEDQEERYPIYLYHRVAARVDLRGRDVLEVGSGRGGGASYVTRYLKPRRMVGVDISGRAVAFSNKQHALANLHFQQGDAERLPFTDHSFDAVINVESSFCYPSIDRFFDEVRRVLRPGGYLHYTDLRLSYEVADWKEAIERSGLELVVVRDITANVIEALHRDSARRRAGGRRIAGRLFAAVADVFTGVDGTRIPSMLAAGDMVYCSFLMQKPLESQPVRAYAAG